MKKTTKITESDLKKIIRRIIKEQTYKSKDSAIHSWVEDNLFDMLDDSGIDQRTEDLLSKIEDDYYSSSRGNKSKGKKAASIIRRDLPRASEMLLDFMDSEILVDELIKIISDNPSVSRLISNDNEVDVSTVMRKLSKDRNFNELLDDIIDRDIYDLLQDMFEDALDYSDRGM